MDKYVPIQTVLGTLKGRDCIYLDDAAFQNGVNQFVLKGEINGNLCSKKRTGIDIPYEIIFFGVMALKMVELDSCDSDSESSFDEVIGSSWIKSLGGKVDTNHHHYYFQTYDEVFEVVCDRYKFIVKQ